jgi:hypothetical protein
MSVLRTCISFFPAYAKDTAEKTRADDIQEDSESITIRSRDISSDDETEAVVTALDHSLEGQTNAMFLVYSS